MLSSTRIEELRTKFEDNPRRYFAPLANEYRKSGRIDDAVALCREQLARYPDHMSGHIVLGQSLFEARSLDEAASVFETAIALDGENLIALRHLGDIARERGQTDVARGWYERVLVADPQHEDVAAQLAALGVAGPHAGRETAAGAPGIEVPSFAGALATAVAAAADAPARYDEARDAEPPATGSAAAPGAWEAQSLEDLIERSDDVILLDAPTDDEPMILSPRLLDTDASQPVEGLEFDPVVALDEPPEPIERAPLVGFAAPGSAAQLPPLDLHFDDFSAESLRSPHEESSDFGSRDASEAGGADGSPGVGLPELHGDDERQSELVEARGFEADVFEEGPFEELALGVAVPPVGAERLPEHDEPEPDDRPALASPPTAPAFVTETMAELYLQQGFTQQALDVFRQLAALRPWDDALALRISAIEAQLTSAPDGSTGASTSLPTLDAEAGANRPPDTEFGPPTREPIGIAAWNADGDTAPLHEPVAAGQPTEGLELDAAGDDVDGGAMAVAEHAVGERAPGETETGEHADAEYVEAEQLAVADPASVRVAEADDVDAGVAGPDVDASNAPLSARAFFASLAVRRPTPSSTPLAGDVTPAAGDEPPAAVAAASTAAVDERAAETLSASNAPVADVRGEIDGGIAGTGEHGAGPSGVEAEAVDATGPAPAAPVAELRASESAAELAIPSVHGVHDESDAVRAAASLDLAVELTAVAHVAELPAPARPSLDALFSAAAASRDDENAAARLSAAFGAGDESAAPLLASAPAPAAPPLRPEPTPTTSAPRVPSPAPAPRASVSVPPAVPAAAPTAAYSFDKFFADDAPAAPPGDAADTQPEAGRGAAAASPTSTAERAPEPPASADDDIAQFNDWLRGLRDS